MEESVQKVVLKAAGFLRLLADGIVEVEEPHRSEAAEILDDLRRVSGPPREAGGPTPVQREARGWIRKLDGMLFRGPVVFDVQEVREIRDLIDRLEAETR